MIAAALPAPARSAADAAPAAPWAALHGSDFAGGGAPRLGTTTYQGVPNVNLVYAQPAGDACRMSAVVTLEWIPAAAPPLFLYVEGRDDDLPSVRCPVEIRLNGTRIYAGDSGFPHDRFEERRFPLPPGALHAGRNELVIENTSRTGSFGNVPWFMAAACAIAPDGFRLADWKRRERGEFAIRLPVRADSFLERAAAGERPSGFALRGTKGWGWTPEQYLAEIPVLARYRMNFLMNCYSSLFSQPPDPSGKTTGWKNEWWLPLPAAKKRAYEKVFRACRDSGITFCFAIHPQLASPRPLDPTSDADFETLWPHYAWAQGQGVRWFALSLDDVSGVKINGAEHARFVNKLLARLREKDPGAQMLFCPTLYWGDGDLPGQRAYLEALARELAPDVYVFWTGPAVVPARITRRDAEAFRGIVKHRVILWDNYPVNDGHPALHLGPVTGRDPALPQVLDGYMSNPHFTQNEINRIPLFTMADYAFAPARYDPETSIGQALLHQDATPAQREALREMVELFPSLDTDTGHNDLMEQFTRIAAEPHSEYVATLLIERAEAVDERMDRLFPKRYRAARATLRQTIGTLRRRFKEQYGHDPVRPTDRL